MGNLNLGLSGLNQNFKIPILKFMLYSTLIIAEFIELNRNMKHKTTDFKISLKNSTSNFEPSILNGFSLDQIRNVSLIVIDKRKFHPKCSYRSNC